MQRDQREVPFLSQPVAARLERAVFASIRHVWNVAPHFPGQPLAGLRINNLDKLAIVARPSLRSGEPPRIDTSMSMTKLLLRGS
jgi:hypothetical protein